MYYRPGNMLPPYPRYTRRAKVRRFFEIIGNLFALIFYGAIVLALVALHAVFWWWVVETVKGWLW